MARDTTASDSSACAVCESQGLCGDVLRALLGAAFLESAYQHHMKRNNLRMPETPLTRARQRPPMLEQITHQDE